LEDRYDPAHPTVEWRAEAPANVWIVELGDETQWGSFDHFVTAVSGAPVEIDGLDVTYRSPTIGSLQFGWHGPLRVDGDEIALHKYPRFDNPYCQADFASRQYTIRYRDHFGDGDSDRHGDEAYAIDFGPPSV
jgi:hypothetical protein